MSYFWASVFFRLLSCLYSLYQIIALFNNLIDILITFVNTWQMLCERACMLLAVRDISVLVARHSEHLIEVVDVDP